MANLHIVEASDVQPIKNGYRIKVNVLDLGFYAFGFTARKSDKNKSGWWVQPPAIKVGSNSWKQTIEFDKSKSLWSEIEDACIDAVAEQERLTNLMRQKSDIVYEP